MYSTTALYVLRGITLPLMPDSARATQAVTYALARKAAVQGRCSWVIHQNCSYNLWRTLTLVHGNSLGKHRPIALSRPLFTYIESNTGMNRSGMLEQLAHAVRRVHEVQELINRQRGRILDLCRRGHGTQNAESVLAQLEQSQMLYASDTERLEAKLEELE